MDEWCQVSYYNDKFHEIIYLAASQTQPPLDYWIGHVIYYYAQSDFAVRLPAAMFGTGSVAILMLLVARISGWHFAIPAGAVMALLPFHLYFSQEARPYAIAIFFLLLLLWMLAKMLETAELKKRHYIALLFIACGFLFSRTLSPLVTVTSIIGLLFIQAALLTKNEGFMASRLQKKLFVIMAVLILAILIFLPNLMFILEMNQRYAPQASQVNISVLYQGLKNFSLIPIWQAYLVQLEPLGYPLFLLSLLSLLLVFILPHWRQNPILITVIFLLPLAAVLHAFIFLAKTSLPFRPPYAIYIMPLALIGGTHVLRELWQRQRQRQWIWAHHGKMIFAVLSILIFGSLLYTDKHFYNTQKKTDWRGLAQYLEQQTDGKHLLLSDTFVKHPNFPKRAWEPNFYVFERYYNGRATGIVLHILPIQTKEFLVSKLQPVLIFFEWHAYFLTPYSPYPIIPQGNRKQPDFSKLADDPAIKLKRFTGFSVLQLTETAGQGNLAEDTLMLLRKIMPLLPEDSSSIDIVMVVSALENGILENNLQCALTNRESKQK
jgi:hypothetical protein